MADNLKLPRVGPCRFCGHSWHPRKPSMPERCGRCKRFKWQKVKK